MKKIKEIILAFVSAKNEYESKTHANKLVMISSAVILLVGAILNLIIYSLFADFDMLNIIINSAVMLITAALFLLIDRLFKSEKTKYYLYILLFCTALILTVLRFYTHIGPAVWTVGFIAVLLSLIRNNRLMIGAVSLVFFILGIYVWVFHPGFALGQQYYIIQFASLAVVFSVGGGIIYINAEKYRKISHYLNESEMLRQISTDFISVTAENIDEKVKKMLESTSKYYNVEEAQLLLLSEDREKIRLAYDWFADGRDSLVGTREEYEVSSNPDWLDQLENKTVWIIPNIDALDLRVAPGKETLQALQIKAMISAPIVFKDKVFGILYYESLKSYKKWEDAHEKLLVVLTNLLAEAFAQVEAEKDINYMAFYDALTGLPNRFLFNNFLDSAIAEAENKSGRIAVIFIDLDSFKSVNDTTGHEGGDELLKQVASNLRERIGELGTAARFGGDEFIILIPEAGNTENIKSTADLIMGTFNRPMKINDKEFFITASAGIAVYPEDGRNSSTLSKNADLAMYAAKALGKNQSAFCTPALKEDTEHKVQLTNYLYRAMQKNELVLHYQPLIDISTEKIIGVEALLRWNHPELGMIAPNVFIPLAEQTGLINSIGKWVLETACRQNKMWMDHGYAPFRMAVNLSVEQFHNPNLVDVIRGALESSGLPPRYLELEITESVAIKETDYICLVLEDMKALGVTISIDDFGTEYSSLARLRQLPIDRIKMAMEFVHGINVSEKDEAIAKVIINLASNLGLKVVAEGVETESQLEFLKNRVCDEVQGYYFYKPMPAEELEKILAGLNTEKPTPSTPEEAAKSSTCV